VVVAALGAGGVYMPDPDCGGSSLETIPPTLTPVVHKNAVMVRASDLSRLKAKMKQVLDTAEEAEQALVPRKAGDVRMLRGKLEGALESMR
jgi:hypothetical protein